MKRISPGRVQPDTVVAILVMGLLVPLLATISAVVGPYATAAFIALMAAGLSFALPIRLLVLMCFLAASVAAGMLEYFAGITQAYWLPYLLGALLAARALTENMRPAPRRPMHAGRQVKPTHPSVHPITWLSMVYVAAAVFGLIVSLPPVLQVIVAAKNYFFMWGIFLVLLCGKWSDTDSSKLWTWLIAVACIQWPVVLYQRFVVAAGRTDAAAWDAIVGTFGGNPESGGHSPGMAFVCCLAVAALVCRMREKKMGYALGSLLLLMCLAPIALAEVKAAFIWLVVVFLVLFAKQFVDQPVRATATLVVGATLLSGLGLIYQTTYQTSGGGNTLQEIYEKQLKYSFDPNEYRSDLKRLGRVTAIVYWWERHDLDQDPVAMLVGHGVGASRSTSSLAVGELARKLPIPVDVNAASMLLWDVGLLGAASFLALLLVGGVAALRLSQRSELAHSWRESTLLAACVLAMASLGLFYNKDAIDDPVVQTLVFFSISQVMLARRELAVRVGRALPASRVAIAKSTNDIPAPVVTRRISGTR